MPKNVDSGEINELMNSYFFSNPQRVLFWMYHCEINEPQILQRDIEKLSGLSHPAIYRALEKLTSKKYRYVKKFMTLVPKEYHGHKWMMKLEFTKDEYRKLAKEFYQLILRHL